MPDYYSSREAHIARAQALLQSQHGPQYLERLTDFPRISQSAYAMAIHWLADFVERNPQWVEQLKRVLKQPVVDGIVARLGLSGFEVAIANVFVGVLLDVAFAAFLRWESNRGRSGQTTFNGNLPEMFIRWRAEVPLTVAPLEG